MPVKNKKHDGEYIIVEKREGFMYADRTGCRFFSSVEEVAKTLVYLENCGYKTSTMTILKVSPIPFEGPVITIASKIKRLAKVRKF